MDALTKSCSPTTVIPANGEVQTHEEATVCVKELDTHTLDYESPREYASSLIARKALRWKTDVLMSGSTVKNHISLKTGFGYSATRRTSFRSWFLACHRVLPPTVLLQHHRHIQDRRLIILHLPQARLLHQPQLCQATVRPEHGEDQERRDPCTNLVPDHKGKKPYNETCFKNPQSCSWLVVW